VAAPEGAATLAGLKKCLGRGDVAKEERVLLFNTGSGLKYPMHGEFLRIDKDRPVDFERILRWRCDRRGAS
jgi:threonine synthase